MIVTVKLKDGSITSGEYVGDDDTHITLLGADGVFQVERAQIVVASISIRGHRHD